MTKIDVQKSIKAKLCADIKACRNLEACSPNMSYQAIGVECRVGAMLPWNIVLRAVEEGVDVSTMDKGAYTQAIDNVELIAVADDVRDMLAKAIAAI